MRSAALIDGGGSVTIAAKLKNKATADCNPSVENAAPKAKQDEMRDLKQAGWFLKRELVRLYGATT